MRAFAMRGLLAAVATAAIAVNITGLKPAMASGGCSDVWTDQSGDAYQNLPYTGAPAFVGLYQQQLDLLGGTAWQSGSDLVVRVKVADMEPVLPAGRGAESWETRWHLGGGALFTWVEYGAEGTFYGFGAPDGSFHLASGAMVTGSGGYVEVEIPLSAIGSPAAGTTMTFDGATAWEWAAGVVFDPSGLPDLSPTVTWGNGFNPSVLGDPVDVAPGGGTTVIGATCP
jgi:hypothetical protein